MTTVRKPARKKLSRAQMSTPQGKFAVRLRREMDRNCMGVSALRREMLAYGVEVTTDGIHKWLRGDAIPLVMNLAVLAKIFGASIYSDLLPLDRC